MQKARSHPYRAPTACRRTVSSSISPPCSGCFSPFLHSTCPLSVSRECLALADGPARFTQDSSCPALLRIPLSPILLRIRVCHPLRTSFPECSPHNQGTMSRSYNPATARRQQRFRLFPGRSPLLGESLFIFSSWRY